MQLHLITSNVSKYEEIKNVLSAYQIKVKRLDIDIPEIKSLDPQAVIKDKINKAYQIVKKHVIVDDTGIFFKGYKNFPGMISRFVFLTLGFKGIFKLINNNQPAVLKSYVGYLDNSLKQPKIFIGTCPGKLIKRIKGPRRSKMPYDNIFIPSQEKKTFAELGMDGKQKYDHRSKAVRKLVKYLMK